MPAPATWQQQLVAILAAHNERHASRAKVVAHETQAERRESLFRMFRLLRALGYEGGGARPAGGAAARGMLAFGLRRKEAVMFAPGAAEVLAHALPEGAGNGERYLAFLRIKRGTKVGRLRYTALRNEAQRTALARAGAGTSTAATPAGSVR